MPEELAAAAIQQRADDLKAKVKGVRTQTEAWKQAIDELIVDDFDPCRLLWKAGRHVTAVMEALDASVQALGTARDDDNGREPEPDDGTDPRDPLENSGDDLSTDDLSTDTGEGQPNDDPPDASDAAGPNDEPPAEPGEGGNNSTKSADRGTQPA